RDRGHHIRLWHQPGAGQFAGVDAHGLRPSSEPGPYLQRHPEHLWGVGGNLPEPGAGEPPAGHARVGAVVLVWHALKPGGEKGGRACEAVECCHLPTTSPPHRTTMLSTRPSNPGRLLHTLRDLGADSPGREPLEAAMTLLAKPPQPNMAEPPA